MVRLLQRFFVLLSVSLLFQSNSIQAEKQVVLNPPLESLPEGEFIPVVLDQATLKLYWMAPEKNIRNGVHSLIVREVTGENYQEISQNKRANRFIAGGFIKTDGNTLNFHGRNSFNSTTFHTLSGLLDDASRKKLLDYISVEFPKAVFRANTQLFDPGNHGYTQEHQAGIAEVLAYGWQKQVEEYNDPKTKETAHSFIAVKRFALACKEK